MCVKNQLVASSEMMSIYLGFRHTETRVAHGKPDWVNWLSRLEKRSSADLHVAVHGSRGRLNGIRRILPSLDCKV
jgi:hypothetical protein